VRGVLELEKALNISSPFLKGIGDAVIGATDKLPEAYDALVEQAIRDVVALVVAKEMELASKLSDLLLARHESQKVAIINVKPAPVTVGPAMPAESAPPARSIGDGLFTKPEPVKTEQPKPKKKGKK
jgi:hypothetical protein